MYYFAFWFLSWLILGSEEIRLGRTALIGVTLAGLSLVKVHAIFLLPGVCAAIVARYLITGQHRKIATVITMLVGTVAAAALVRLAAGYLFAGQAGLHVLGQKYGDVASSYIQMGSGMSLVKGLLFAVEGHVTALALLFGMPLASLMACSRTGNNADAARSLYVLRIYTLAVIIFLLLVTAYYTVLVAPQAHESLGRLHFRYYNFALPLLLIVCAGEWSAPSQLGDLRRRLVAGLIIGTLAVFAALNIRTRGVQNIVDSPELWVLFASRAALYAIACVNLAALGIWVWNRRRGAGLFLFVAVPFTIIVSMWFIAPEIRGRLHSDTYEQAAQAARQIVGVREIANLAVVGSDEVDLYRALYQIDSPKTTMVLLPERAALHAEGVPANDTWLLVIGDHAVPQEFERQFSRDSYSLFKKASREQ